MTATEFVGEFGQLIAIGFLLWRVWILENIVGA